MSPRTHCSTCASRPGTATSAYSAFFSVVSSVGLNGTSMPPPGSGRTVLSTCARSSPTIARAWSLVHGFTTLLLDGRLQDILRRLPAGTEVDHLLDAMLRSTVPRPVGASHNSQAKQSRNNAISEPRASTRVWASRWLAWVWEVGVRGMEDDMLAS